MTTTTPCPSCGANATGKFCAECGAPIGKGSCRGCGTSLTPGAKFCHRCGLTAGAPARTTGAAARGPWVAAALLSIILVGWVIWRVNRGVEVAPPPAEASTGANAPFAGGGGSPPDLSQMTPKDAFLRLHDRIMGALEQGDSATAAQFTPMAIQAYGMLPAADRDVDIRYHAATLMIGGGDLAAAKALTDSLDRQFPKHLFVDMLRAGLAEGRNDPAAAKRAYQRFLADWDAQLATARPEYVEHRPLLDAFKERATQLK